MAFRHLVDHKSGLSPAALALRSEFAARAMPKLKEMTVADCTVEVLQGADSLWMIVTRPGCGGFALRTAFSMGVPIEVETTNGGDRDIQYRMVGSLGAYQIRLVTPNSEEASIRCTVEFTPSDDLLITYWPRDLFPIDENGDAAATEGVVNAAQRGLNAGVLYLSLNTPAFGSLLYYQNFTALNDYFEATGTRPDGRVGGNWPELGYEMPRSETSPLKGGKTIVISDAFVCWNNRYAATPQESAALFLDFLADVYRRLDPERTEYHDWPSLADRTLDDLQRSPEALVDAYGHTYLHPYTNAEYPDSMVQLTVLMAVREYAARSKSAAKFADRLRAGVPKFFDKKLGTIRRYLPNVGKDKNKNEVDSWYLYHPMANLGRLALEGDLQAKEEFLASAAFGIKAAQRFEYRWPIQFDIETFDVIKLDRKPGDPGQSDTGGLYAYVMLQAYRLTDDELYLLEARRAIDALDAMRFELEYQANITGWAANACLQLASVTGDRRYADQSLVFLAGFFHNSIIWESSIGNARHYRNFLAPTCLHDGPYMALYECYEAYAAFHEYLTWGKSDLPQSVRLLLSEYIKYAITRAWYYYPMNLPEEALATEVRNGNIDRKLAFPLEDLYADGQPAGQVGQEIYGCGAAFAIVTRSYHRLVNYPYTLYCEYPIFDLQEPATACVAFRIRGVEGFYCQVRLIAGAGEELPQIHVRDGDGCTLRCRRTKEGHWEFRAPAAKGIEILW